MQTTRKGKRTLSYPSTKAATEEEEESDLDSDPPPPSELPSPSQRLSLQLNYVEEEDSHCFREDKCRKLMV